MADDPLAQAVARVRDAEPMLSAFSRHDREPTLYVGIRAADRDAILAALHAAREDAEKCKAWGATEVGPIIVGYVAVTMGQVKGRSMGEPIGYGETRDEAAERGGERTNDVFLVHPVVTNVGKLTHMRDLLAAARAANQEGM